jgi:probable HAF family extracellular repeat protein
MRDLGRLPGSLITAGSGSQAVAINGFGQVVGWSLNSSGESRAVIWQKNKITDLNDLARATSGLVFARAIAINDQGQILVEQQSGPTAPINSFLLTPLNK